MINKKFSLLLVLSILSFMGFSQKWESITSTQPVPADLSLISSSTYSSEIQVTLKGFYIEDIAIKNATYHRITLENGTQLLEKNAPDLPKLTTSLIIPDMANTTVKVLKSKYKEYKNIEIAPSKGNFTRDIDPATVKYNFGVEYFLNKDYPGDIAKLRDPFILRDYRGQTIVVQPFQYNPVTKTLRVYYDLKIKLETGKGNPVNPFIAKNSNQKINQEFNQIYQHQFLNYNSSKYTALGDYGKMLIITHPNYLSAMQPFVEWKNLSGIPTEIVTTTTAGSTASAIKTYVNTYYNTNGLTFLLLVGDDNFIPTNSLSSGHSDNAYGYLTGNDSYPEIFVGRFSAESVAHVNTQVERIIGYEKNPSTSTGGFNTNIGIASNQGPGDDNEMDYDHIRNMQNDLLAYTYGSRYEFFDGSQGGLDASGNPSSTMVGNAINSGAGNILYCGHGSSTSWGSSGFSNSDIANLSNTEVLPFIWSVACVNGNFVNKTCFAEAWMRSTNAGNPIGAVSTLMSTINQSWDPPMDAQDEMVDILTESYSNNIKRTFGGLSMNGCMKMNDSYGSQGDEITDTWTLFGDPSLMVRTDTPVTFTATYLPTMFTGSTSFTINCPVNDARATLSKNGQIIATDVVNNGTVVLNFNAIANVDTFDLVITAYNKIPYISTVMVTVPSGPYLTFKECTVSDPNGNNNAKPDFDEVVELNVSIENIGLDNASQVEAKIRTKDSYITLNDTTGSWGLIPDSTDKMLNAAFEIKIADNIPDQHQPEFKIIIEDSLGNTWTETFQLTLNAPQLTAKLIAVVDAQGNDPDPGETVTMTIEVENTGHSNSPQVYSTTAPSSTFSQIVNPNNLNAAIATGGTDTYTYTIKLDSLLPVGTSIGVDFTATYGAYTFNDVFYFQAGKVDEDFETGDMTKFAWNTGGHKAWFVSTDATPDGQYCMRSGLISHGQQSMLTLYIDVLGDDSISFYRKVDCEDGSSSGQWWDYLEFMIDNNTQGQWDGSKSWAKETFAISAGSHQLKWVYRKDYAVSDGMDCAWLDMIEFPPLATPAAIKELPDYSGPGIAAYPNPVKDQLNIDFRITENAPVTIGLYNSLGQLVQTITEKQYSKGVYSQTISTADLDAGIYIIRMQTAGIVNTLKVVK
jgi:hypothetical protein